MQQLFGIRVDGNAKDGILTKLHYYQSDDVVAQWCNPLTLKSEQSGGVGSIPGGTPPLECHGKGLRTRLGLLYFCEPSAWR